MKIRFLMGFLFGMMLGASVALAFARSRVRSPASSSGSGCENGLIGTATTPNPCLSAASVRNRLCRAGR